MTSLVFTSLSVVTEALYSLDSLYSGLSVWWLEESDFPLTASSAALMPPYFVDPIALPLPPTTCLSSLSTCRIGRGRRVVYCATLQLGPAVTLLTSWVASRSMC